MLRSASKLAAQTSTTTRLCVAPAPPRRKVDWHRARVALRGLVADPEKTHEVFELIEALAGEAGEGHFQRFLAHPGSETLLREKPDLIAALSDFDSLASLPPESLGAHYLRFMRDGGIDAEGLVTASEQIEREDLGRDPDRIWFFDRVRDMHDLWHVLTGYGRDIAGEAANLAFTYAQVRNRGVGLIVLTSMHLGPWTLDCHWQRYLGRAYLRGRRADLLSAAPYEAMLKLPLPEVRKRLLVEAPPLAHPQGILVDQGGILLPTRPHAFGYEERSTT
jgi:ubiquinone biosynthesis protein COQ4